MTVISFTAILGHLCRGGEYQHIHVGILHREYMHGHVPLHFGFQRGILKVRYSLSSFIILTT